MWKYIVEADRPQITIWRLSISCWISKAINTHSEYALLVAFPQKQCLHKSSSFLHYIRIACLVFPLWHTMIGMENWNIQGVFKKMLVQTWCMNSAHQNSSYHCMLANRFGGTVSLPPNLRSVVFCLWDTRIPSVFTSNWTWRDTLPTHSWCLSNIRNCPGTCGRVQQFMIIHADGCFDSGGRRLWINFFSICNCMCFYCIWHTSPEGLPNLLGQ